MLMEHLLSKGTVSKRVMQDRLLRLTVSSLNLMAEVETMRVSSRARKVVVEEVEAIPICRHRLDCKAL